MINLIYRKLNFNLFNFYHRDFLKSIVFIVLSAMNLQVSANDFDQRQVISLSEGQKAHVLTEMRRLLGGVQGVIHSLADDDLQSVALHARPLGMAMKKTPESELRDVLPKTFMMMGKAVHQDFDKIANDAETLKNPKHTLQQVSQMINRCQGCHESFRLEAISPKVR